MTFFFCFFDIRDLRARLELAIENVIELASIQQQPVDSDYTSDSEDVSTSLQGHNEKSNLRPQH